ncbi:MAG: magnesium transporter CorA family protein [Pseudomonadota bacterium]
MGMIRAFTFGNGRLKEVENPLAALDTLVWIDLVSPTPEEEAHLAHRLGVTIPAKDELHEIEESNRLYTEDNMTVMTAVLPSGVSKGSPMMAPVAFILSNGRLITVRYHKPKSIEGFSAWAEKIGLDCAAGETALVGMLEVIINREADILEECSRQIDGVYNTIFEDDMASDSASRDFKSLLFRLGRAGDLASKVRDSLVTLDRMVTFLYQIVVARKGGSEKRARLKTILRDIDSLSAHSDSLAQKVTFLLDATLGLVNIEQNSIIKIFSVVAVIFMPPTLVASIYGMNFVSMPELHFAFGYPMAVVMMFISALMPYLLFKRKGWL